MLALEWLKDRRQRVVITGKLSEWIPVTSGVPQGSILGPILFAIFINDIDDGIADMVALVLKFADDTSWKGNKRRGGQA